MVRRWSYINLLNQPITQNFMTSWHSSFEATVNAYMYLRKPFYPATKLTRRRWARRRHLTNWIALSTVMSNWASSYLFYRQVEKSIYAQLLTKHSYVALSILNFKNSIPALHKNTEKVLASSVIKKVFTYYTHFSSPRLKFLQAFKFTNLTFVSLFGSAHTSKASLPSFLAESPTAVPFLVDNYESFTPTTTNFSSNVLNPLSNLQLVFSLMLRLSIASIIALRRLFVRLLSFSLRNQ